MNPLALTFAGAAAAPSPSPFPAYTGNVNLITPGVAGFIAILVVAAVTILLLIDMTRRIRRSRYREEIRIKLEAEQAEADAAEAAAARKANRGKKPAATNTATTNTATTNTDAPGAAPTVPKWGSD